MLRAGIKRLSALVFAVLTLSLTLSAAEITENPGKEFWVYGDKQSLNKRKDRRKSLPPCARQTQKSMNHKNLKVIN